MVLKIGHHYAFSFFDDAAKKHRIEYGQLSVLKDKHGCNLIETALMMDDAREIDVQVVCSWFEEDEKTGILKLRLVHPDRYSSQCCIGDVDLELVDAESKTYRFVDPSRRRELQIAHELALPSAQGVAKNSAAGGGGGAKKRARGDVFEAEGLDRVYSEVKRKPGARRATKAAAHNWIDCLSFHHPPIIHCECLRLHVW